MRVFTTVDALRAAAGADLGTSGWLMVTQERVDAFAEATGDFQWIHVDPVRAAAGPYGGTIAHGFLTLSLVPALASEVFRIETAGPRLNYGLDRVRFPAPVPVGARIHCRVRLAEVADAPTGVRLTLDHTVEVEGGTRPACVARQLVVLPGS